MSHHIVEAKDLRFSYPDGTKALEKISFLIKHGEAVALVGENGAGKSTLLQHFTGCLLPDSGALSVGGVAVGAGTLREIRGAVGMVFQNPDDQLFMPTVFDDVAFGLLNSGVPGGELPGRVSAALERVGASALAARPPYRLSHGQKRAVAIASVLAMEPDILVMDEPTSGLDPLSRRRLIELLKTFPHTKVIATHDLDFALELCARTIVIHGGGITADGPSGEIFADEDLLARSNLEPPPSFIRR